MFIEQYSRRCGLGAERCPSSPFRAPARAVLRNRRAEPCAKVKEEMTEGARYRFLGYGACALAGTIWGTGFYFGRLALNEMSVDAMVLYRFLFACLGIAPVMLFGRVRLNRAEKITVLLTAAFGIPIQFLLQFHGLAMTTVSHASLMVGAMPVLLAASAAIFAGERLDWIGWVALCGSTAGAGLVVVGGTHTGGENSSFEGDMLVIISLIVALAWILLSKKLMEKYSAPVVTAYTIYWGTAMLVAWNIGCWALAPWTHEKVEPLPFAHVSMTAWIALAVSGLLCTATTTVLWNWGIRHVPASRAGVFMNIEPVIGSILGVQLLGEKLGPHAWVGGALILGAAIALTTREHEPETGILLD
jgi:drug/metabolite transporter (DMT)-like permease